MRRLNAINDPLHAASLPCTATADPGRDSDLDKPVPMTERTTWGCETTSLIAAHYAIEYRTPTDEDD